MRSRTMWKLMAVLGVLMLVTGACAEEAAETTTTGADPCAIESLNLVTPGTLTIATGLPAFPPWIIDDDPTNKQGFEGAVGYAIAGKLGFADDQVTWVRTDFFEAITAGPKDFDFNLQQYSITTERDEVVDFSVPYYVTDQALIAYADSPVVDAETVDDLKGYRLGAQLATTSLAYIDAIIQPDEKASVYDTNVDAKSALDAGQIDGLVFDLPTAFYITAVEIPDASIVGVLEASPEQADLLGALFEEGNPLVSCVNQALEELRDEGILIELAEQWIVTGSDLKTITK